MKYNHFCIVFFIGSTILAPPKRFQSPQPKKSPYGIITKKHNRARSQSSQRVILESKKDSIVFVAQQDGLVSKHKKHLDMIEKERKKI